MTLSLQNKVAIVTGGSRGIGFGVASMLLDHAASVVVTGRDAARLEEARDTLQRGRPAGSVVAVATDVRSYDAVEAVVATAVERFGGLDLLVNNAGIGKFSEAAALSVADWQAMIETNLSGVFYGCKAAIPHLKRRGGGWIINISSLASKNWFVGGAAYCATKAGLNAFTDVLMQELRYDNIKVAAILPGSVRTGFAGHEVTADEDWKLTPDDVAQVVLDLIGHPGRSLPSSVELRPSKPKRAR